MFISGLSDQREKGIRAGSRSLYRRVTETLCHMKSSLKKVPTPLTQDVCSKNKHSQWWDGEHKVWIMFVFIPKESRAFYAWGESWGVTQKGMYETVCIWEMCVYKCVYVCAHECECTCVHVCKCMTMHISLNVCVSAHVYKWVCICVWMCECTYEYVCECMTMHICLNVCVHKCTCISVYMWMHMCVYMCVSICVYFSVYVCVWVCVYMCVCIWSVHVI